MTSPGSVPSGTRVGRYEIVSLLGRGGMGEVYAAHDSNLGRQVALKILPSNRTSDPDRVARFVREARASSALNHPAIVSIHDAGSEGNVHFLAMELIDGQSLGSWMKKSRKISRSIEVMAQVAEGLARAHANGIVHRDLKPDNIMITRDGYAKIVDFGVAKLTERSGARAVHTGITTPTSRVGTTAYMSPEQVEGRAIDHRADVFSFGTVLYELVAGSNPFASPQYADTLHNIVHLDPPLDRVPSKLRRIVRRCLRKDPEERYQSMKDVALDLREVLADSEERVASGRRRWIPVAVMAVAAVLTGWFARSRVADSPAPPKEPMVMTRLTNSGQIVSAAVSPDGRYLVYAERVGETQALMVRQIATGTTTTILDPAPIHYYHVRVSPDGNYVYYSAHLSSEPNIANVYQVPLLGGTPRRIAADTETWYSLSPDGQRIVFTRLNAFEREFKMTVASVDGAGEEVILSRAAPEFIDAPVWHPDGKSILFYGGNAERKGTGGVVRLTVATGKIESVPTPSWPGIGSYALLPDGSGALVTAYESDQPPQIWFVPSGATKGQKITSDISAYYSITPTADSQSFSAVRDITDANVVTLSLDDPQGSVTPLTTGFGNRFGVGGVRWLNDRQVIYSDVEGGMNAFFVTSPGGGDPQRIIRNMPVWRAAVSPDGTRIAFVSDKGGRNQIWIADANGENARRLSDQQAGNPSFTADGKHVVYISFAESQFAWRVAVDGTGAPEQITDVPTSRIHASPDGKWLLVRIRSKEGSDGPLWRTALLPANGKGEPRYFAVPRFGSGPQFTWHPGGEGFLFIDAKDGIGNIWLQPVDGSEPRQVTFFTSGLIFAFDVSPDGRSLVLSRGEPARDAVLVRNWR